MRIYVKEFFITITDERRERTPSYNLTPVSLLDESGSTQIFDFKKLMKSQN
jgi:hypothetical protein